MCDKWATPYFSTSIADITNQLWLFFLSSCRLILSRISKVPIKSFCDFRVEDLFLDPPGNPTWVLRCCHTSTTCNRNSPSKISLSTELGPLSSSLTQTPLIFLHMTPKEPILTLFSLVSNTVPLYHNQLFCPPKLFSNNFLICNSTLAPKKFLLCSQNLIFPRSEFEDLIWIRISK